MTKYTSNPLALLGAVFLIGTMSFAQNIHFNYTDGTNTSYNLEDVRKITFNADAINLHLWDGSIYTWNVSTIGDYQYDETSLNMQEWLNNANVWDVNISPNPTSSTLTVRFNLAQAEEVSIELYDVYGKIILAKNTVIKKSGEHQEMLDLSNILQGSYICRISCLNNTITKQLIRH